MPSAAPSLTSTKSRRSSKHDKTKHDRSTPENSVPPPPYTPSHGNGERLVLKTADVKWESSLKTSSPRLELPADTLAVVAGNKVRRSRCTPEFLEEVAKGSSPEISEGLGRKFKILTGSEAVAFYKKFLGGKSTSEIIAIKEGIDGGRAPIPSVVFAVTVYDAGRKLVDYYMTWRGKMRAKDSKERKPNFLDSEFRKVAKSLDKQFRQASIYGSMAGVARSIASSNREVDTPSPSKSEPLSISPPPPENGALTSPTQPPPSATDSVMSLPFLNMIRGVPLGNRVPLRVTNPDRLSMISSSGSGQDVVPQTTQHASIPLTTVRENKGAPSPDTHRPLTPQVVRTSSPSIQSSNSKDSTNSSAASTASSENLTIKRKDRTDSRNDEDKTSEFLIVLLDNKLDKNSRTWHGLERQVSRSSTRTTPSRVTPWDGPLARDNGITYRTAPVKSSPTKGEESSSEEEWENSPVIPLQAFVAAARSHTASEPPTRRGSPVVPVNVQYILPTVNSSPMVSVGNIASSPYGVPLNLSTYSNSPYVPPYLTPYHTPAMSISRPLSRSTYTGFQSPYMP